MEYQAAGVMVVHRLSLTAYIRAFPVTFIMFVTATSPVEYSDPPAVVGSSAGAIGGVHGSTVSSVRTFPVATSSCSVRATVPCTCPSVLLRRVWSMWYWAVYPSPSPRGGAYGVMTVSLATVPLLDLSQFIHTGWVDAMYALSLSLPFQAVPVVAFPRTAEVVPLP